MIEATLKSFLPSYAHTGNLHDINDTDNSYNLDDYHNDRER